MKAEEIANGCKHMVIGFVSEIGMGDEILCKIFQFIEK